ncbi:hypothetical protein CLHUN_23680 [Ruminiclostridium hungatei]|uniref:DUF2953 domain-containing protein n=1 Tax=Ruminiclostridium hungatei TaxID=48256 RepID=A0A1V4SID5_RUMHU|nr:DUF2953 domain-containing protein [Ruminiclostridium hungatei]OPX43649.1 hypothetical protein CLHUN_23680 [Ruminiclostridium hungatei]
MVIFIVIGIFLSAILFIFCSKLTVGFIFKMDKLACSAYVIIYLFGKIPAKKITIYPVNKEKKKKIKPRKVRRKVDVNQLRKSLWVLVKLFYRSVFLRRFKLNIRAGTGDASQTALLYGLLWSFTSFIPGWLFNNFSVKEKEIRIEADFDEKVWKVDFDCIFSLKIVNIISIVREIIKIYLKNRKGGDAGVRSSNRRSNDYSHAKY